MKKFICGLILGLLLATSISTFASGQALRLIVNGEDITAEAQPVIIDGRTLVPARALAERLGAKVSWNAATQTVVVSSIEESEKEASLQPAEEEKTYRIGEEFQLGETTIKCTGVSYTAGKMPSAPTPGEDEQYIIIEFDIKTDEEPKEFYYRPNNFIRSIAIGGKTLSSNFFCDLNEKIYKGEQKTVTVYRLIPKNSKVDAIQFRGTYAGPFATVLLD